MNNFANEFCDEMWELIRTIAGATCTTIGCVIGIPVLIADYIGKAFVAAGDWFINGINEKGAFEKDDVEEDEIIYT